MHRTRIVSLRHTFSGSHCLTKKDVVRGLISKMKYEKAVGPSELKSLVVIISAQEARSS